MKKGAERGKVFAALEINTDMHYNVPKEKEPCVNRVPIAEP